jgi:hypothetical protein
LVVEPADLCWGADDNVIASDIGSRGEKIIRTVNINSQRDMLSGKR